MKRNNSGFATYSIVIALTALAIIGLIGWRVAAAGDRSVDQPTPGIPPVTVDVPAGWTLIQNAEAGVQFAMPAAYGNFQTVTDFGNGLTSKNFPDVQTTRLSEVPSSPIMPGLSGAFSFKTYKAGKLEVTSRKYGPTIRLQGDKWVIAKPYEAYNPQAYRAGQEYPDISRTNRFGLYIYTARSGDEGTLVYTLYIYSKDRLHELRLPDFVTGQYGDAAVFNDESLYSDFYKQVLSTVAPF